MSKIFFILVSDTMKRFEYECVYLHSNFTEMQTKELNAKKIFNIFRAQNMKIVCYNS